MGFDVLDSLAVLVKDVHANHGLVEVWVCTLNNFVVDVLLVGDGIKSLEEKLKDSLQVLRARGRHKDVAVSKCNRRGQAQTKGSGLSATTTSGQGHGGCKALIGHGLDEGQNCLSLVKSLGKRNEVACRLRALKALFKFNELLACSRLELTGLSASERAFNGLDFTDVLRNRQDVELIIHNSTGFARRKRQDKPLVETRLDRVVSLGPEPRVDIHGHRVKLSKRVKLTQKQNHDATAFDSLNCTGKKVRGKSLKILKHAHSKGLTQNLVSVLVVAPLDLRGGYKKLKRVITLCIVEAALDLLLDLTHAFLFVSGESKLLFVAPKHRGSCLDLEFAKNVVDVHHLIFTAITDKNNERTVPVLDTIL
mmetsp:Transcript_3534/g.7832  ORF Transcript_3534/g.7832 Transcript_3534/m.7832 type:complete len:365 (-) Transcript_3534:244-1338(-)